MAALDPVMAKLALDLINQFGGQATYRRVQRAYDAGVGNVVESLQDISCRISPPSPYVDDRIDGTSIQRGDAECLVARMALTVTPVQEDRLLFKGVTWTIVEVDPIYSGDEIAAFTLQLRK